MKLIAKVGVTSFLLTINAQFDSAFDSLNIAGEDSNTVSIPSYDPELADDLFDASGEVDEAPVGFALEKRRFFRARLD